MISEIHLKDRMLRASERGTSLQVLLFLIESISDKIAGSHLDASSPFVAELKLNLSSVVEASKAYAFPTFSIFFRFESDSDAFHHAFGGCCTRDDL